MNEHPSTREQIRSFLLTIAERVGVKSFSDQESLVTSSILTSLVLFRVVAFLEETFLVSIEDDEIAIENFENVDKITLLVESKLEYSSPSTRTGDDL